jgi:hypothetical protein
LRERRRFAGRGERAIDGAGELFDFAWLEAAVVAFGHLSQFERGKLDALHFLDRVIHALERTAQRVAAGAGHLDFVPRIFGRAAGPRSFERRQLRGGGASSIAHFVFFDAAFHFDPIGLRQASRGAQNARGELAVAGEQDESTCGVIEAADGENAFRSTAQKMAQSFTAFGIGHGGNDLRRLVQDDVNKFVADFCDATGNFDAIVLGIGLRAELGDNFAVDAHLAAANQFFGVAA